MADDRRQNVTDIGKQATDGSGLANAGEVRHPSSVIRRRSSDIMIAMACGAFAAFMVGMAYAAVPLYSWFCRTTGFGGIPQIASMAPQQLSDRKITVRFDANVGAGLPWRFEPERTSIEVRLGEVVTIFYKVANLSQRDTAGQAAYNVAPTTAGAYFAKINCFCFTEQRLAPREKREMAVVFYVDPALVQDSGQDDLNTITLSYTFFPLRSPPPPQAGEGRVGADGASLAGAERKI
jgi:cytochrome c oxidase assembly protein subunit 11